MTMTTIEKEGKELTTKALSLYDSLKGYKIAQPKDYEKASEDLKNAKQLLKAIDEKRREMTRPLDQAKKNIIAFFKPATEKLNLAIARINQEMAAFRRRQEKEAEEKERAIRQQQEQAGEDSLIFAPEVKPEIPKTVKIRKVWKFRVKDKAAIKPDFLIPDEKTIAELVRKLHQKAEDIVGGIEVYTEEVSYV